MQKEITEEMALALMAKDDSAGLRWFIQRYTPYVSTIVYNIIGQYMTLQDVEEIVSDVFCSLWWNRQKAQAGKVPGYLASIARGHAITRLRGQGRIPTLDFDEIDLSVAGPEHFVIDEEMRRAIQETIDEMPATFKEVFVRYTILGYSPIVTSRKTVDSFFKYLKLKTQYFPRRTIHSDRYSTIIQ